jgi:hypothetical protein
VELHPGEHVARALERKLAYPCGAVGEVEWRSRNPFARQLPQVGDRCGTVQSALGAIELKWSRAQQLP